MPREYVPLAFPPGVYRNGTRYQSKGRWYDSHLVRWHEGAIRPVGGWEVVPGCTPGNSALALRTLHAWRSHNQKARLAMGTNASAHVFTEGSTATITPAGLVTGAVDAVPSTGLYGVGAYGVGPYGKGNPTQVSLAPPAIWQFDNFGNDLLGVLNTDGKIYRWNGTGLFTVITNAPVDNTGVVVTPERFVVALGAGGQKRLVQWSSQEDPDEWDPTVTGSSAGDYPLQCLGAIVCGRRSKGETLIWTEDEMFVMRYIGGQFVYAFDQVGTKCGPIGPNAVATKDGRAYWMGKNGFFVYDGYVRQIPCEVFDVIFKDINTVQQSKSFVSVNSLFNELYVFWPAADAMEPNRYALWNLDTGHWAIGTMARTSAVDRGVYDQPFMAGPNGLVYRHEFGYDRPNANAKTLNEGFTALPAPYAESGPMEIGDGDRVLSLVGLVPDEATRAGQVSGNVDAYLYGQLYPTAPEQAVGPISLANPTSVRLTARQIRVKLQESVAGDWAVGNLRVDGLPGGRR